MLLTDFDFHLPEAQIAQTPLAERDQSRMLLVDRAARTWNDAGFRDFPSRIRPGDCLVVNNTRVFPSRLIGKRIGTRAHAKASGQADYLQGDIEVFLTRQLPESPLLWEALVKPGRKMPVGEQVLLGEGLTAEVVDRSEFGARTIRFHCHPDDLSGLIQQHGHVPLPPYIRRGDEAADRDRYQTVFAAEHGSIAAPTAGLHFTPAVLQQCRDAGATIAEVTLHVGLGTFQPLRHTEVTANSLHTERYEISEQAADQINSARRRVVVGTTSARTLEGSAERGRVRAGAGETRIFIYPGYQFQMVDALLTNFHLPQSSLLMLVCALAGKDFTLNAYRHAVEAGYRFFSYGDCMFVE